MTIRYRDGCVVLLMERNPWFLCPESSGVLREFDEKIRKRGTGIRIREFIRPPGIAYLDWSTGKLWESLGDQDKARAYIGKVRLTGMSGSPKCADFRPVRIKIDD